MTLALGELLRKMKYLIRVFGLTFLSLTLTNCSLCPKKIVSLLEPSILRLFYTNKPLISGETEAYNLLTPAHVVKKEGKNLLETNDGKVANVTKLEIFPSNINLALATFEQTGKKCNCNDPLLRIGNSNSFKTSSSVYTLGFALWGRQLLSEFAFGSVYTEERRRPGDGVYDQALSVSGNTEVPVMDQRVKFMAAHRKSDQEQEMVESLASRPPKLSESECQNFLEAVFLEGNIQGLTFSWGIPITLNFFREYSSKAIAVEIQEQEVELPEPLEEHRWKEEEEERGEIEPEGQKQLHKAEYKARQEELVEIQSLQLQKELMSEKQKKTATIGIGSFWVDFLIFGVGLNVLVLYGVFSYTKKG